MARGVYFLYPYVKIYGAMVLISNIHM